MPLSLSLPDIGGLVSVTGTGGVDISTKAVVKVGFGIHLPTVSPALGSGDPIISGSPELFIDTDPAKTALNVDLHAQTDENTSLQASVGPITMTLGKTYTAESGADCDNATDDNGNGAINDGCPQVGATAEDPLAGQCDNATDDDSADADTKINDGCPVVNKPIVAKVGAKFHLSHDSGEVVIDPSQPDAADRLDRRPDPDVDRRLPAGRARRVPGLPEHGRLRPVRRLRDRAGVPARGRRVPDREHHVRGREHLRPEHVGRRGRPVDRDGDPRPAARLDDDRARPPHGHAQPAGRPRRLGVRRRLAAGDRPLARRGGARSSRRSTRTSSTR